MSVPTLKTSALGWIHWPSVVALVVILLFLAVALTHAPSPGARAQQPAVVATAVATLPADNGNDQSATMSPLERQLQERELCQCHQ